MLVFHNYCFLRFHCILPLLHDECRLLEEEGIMDWFFSPKNCWLKVRYQSPPGWWATNRKNLHVEWIHRPGTIHQRDQYQSTDKVPAILCRCGDTGKDHFLTFPVNPGFFMSGLLVFHRWGILRLRIINWLFRCYDPENNICKQATSGNNNKHQK